MAAKGMMNSKHARSPVIKIVAGENEIFSDEDLDVPLNVFYVNKSLLLENSTYFTIILDSAPDRAVVFLPEHNFEIVADWLNLLYQGALEKSKNQSIDLFTVQNYFKFADLVGSEKLKNVVMDLMQEQPLEGWSLDCVRVLETFGLSTSIMGDFVFECLAYRIVLEGWTMFTKQRSVRQNPWTEFISDKSNHHHLNRLLSNVDELNKAKDQKALICPTERRDCKWHEHINDGTKAKCPGSNAKQTGDFAEWSIMSSDDDTPSTDGPVVNGVETLEIQDNCDGSLEE